MTRFYTRTGDDGFTGLLGEGRVPKYHPRMEAVGTIDEATAALGIVRASCWASSTAELLLAVQRDLYNVMAEISATHEAATRFRVIDGERVAWLEEQIDELSTGLEIPSDFILPGDSPTGAAIDLARTIIRRAERQVTRLSHSGDIDNPELLRYLNRLSSLCFVLELFENQAWGKSAPTLAKGNPTG
jgi:cob(I)alamin adenosyltransferase